MECCEAWGGDFRDGGGAVEDWGCGGGNEEGADVVDIFDLDEGGRGGGRHCC